MSTNKSGVYQIRHAISGKVYVGSAIHIGRRWRQHRYRLTRGTHCSPFLQNAWTKYGAGQFVFEVLEIVENPQELERIEQEHIDRRRASGAIYNTRLVAGSQLGMRRSPETCARISAAKRGKNRSPEKPAKSLRSEKGRWKHLPDTLTKIGAASRGQYRSPEWRAKIAASLRGHKVSPEARARLSVANKGKKLSPESIARTAAFNRGRPRSPETRAKISATHQARKGGAA